MPLIRITLSATNESPWRHLDHLHHFCRREHIITHSQSTIAALPYDCRSSSPSPSSCTMSWQAYIDDQLMQPLSGGGTLLHAAIVGHDGGVWAQNDTFPEITDEEVEAIMKGFDDASVLAVNGLRIGGEKYMVLAGEPGEVLRGKKGPGGVTVKKTHSAIVVGIYGDGVTPGECNVAVETLGDYLKDQGI